MTEHEAIRELLSLAAAGALDAADEQRIGRHLRECGSCAAEFEQLQGLANSLRRLPTPQAPASLVERTRVRMEWQLAEEAENRWNYRVLVFLILFAWTLVLATWPVVRLLSNGMLGWFQPGFGRTWLSLAGYTVMLWVTGGVAAATLALRRRRERRIA
jgi:predicted anti-sigma-YlaC factor YlaD